MSDTTRKDNELRMEIIRKTSTRMSLSDVDIVMQIVKQYGIQERIDEAELLRLKQYTTPDPIKPRSQKIRAVSVFDIDERLAELTALKDKQETEQ